MANAAAWIRSHPGLPVLIAALVVGQAWQSISRPYVEQSVPLGQFPVVSASALAGGVMIAIVVIVLRARLGQQMLSAVRGTSLSVPAPESLPARYVLPDPPVRAALAFLALIDVALLLLVQNTIHASVLSLADNYVSRQQATTAYVVLVVILSLVLLFKLYRTGAPVLVLLLWWGLDRVIPTAGFLGARAALAPSGERAPVLAPPPPPRDMSQEPTLLASEADRDTRHDVTVISPLTAHATDLEPTVVASESSGEARQDATIFAPLTTTSLAPRSDKDDLDAPTIVTVPRPDPQKP
jgi:hypothetical protein